MKKGRSVAVDNKARKFDLGAYYQTNAIGSRFRMAPDVSGAYKMSRSKPREKGQSVI